MQLTNDIRNFIRDHAHDDPAVLLLQAHRYPDWDMSFIAEQIAARKVIREKLPTWWENQEIIYPSRLAAEQCSSEQTGRYKQRLIQATDRVIDLTGGMGVDSYFLSQKAAEVVYVERQSAYCEAAKHNYRVLGASIQVVNAEAEPFVASGASADVFYLDPDRRVDGNKRLYSLEDSRPNLLTLLPLLLTRGERVIAKLSPMADITLLMKSLPQTTAVHVLSVRNEVKELLFQLSNEPLSDSIPIHCVHYPSSGVESLFTFSYKEEQETVLTYAQNMATYLYESNASLLKAGAYKSVAARYSVQKLHPNSHLYTSSECIDFPGRRFEVLAVHPSGNKTYKQLGKWYPKANLTVRNFPMSVAELRQRARMEEGGELYLFATTLADNQRVIIACKKVS